MEFLSSPWVIGIGGGVLSGLVVTFITRFLFSRADNREYAQRVVTANQEILYAVRPGISEGVIPSQEIISSLVNATASKYRVDSSSLSDSNNLAEVLTKEVMDSSFLSAAAKMDFCDKLAQLRPVAKTKAEQIEIDATPRRISAESFEFRQRFISRMSMMLGLMAAVMSILFVVIRQLDAVNLKSTFLPAIAAGSTITVAFITPIIFWFFRKIDRASREDRDSKRPEEHRVILERRLTRKEIALRGIDRIRRTKPVKPSGNNPCPPKDKED